MDAPPAADSDRDPSPRRKGPFGAAGALPKRRRAQRVLAGLAGAALVPCLMAALASHGSHEPRRLEIERLAVKTARVNLDPRWTGSIDPDLQESDFARLEALQVRVHDTRGRAWTLNNHAVFLANLAHPERAMPFAQQAAALAPRDARVHVTLGNLFWDLGAKDRAERAYRSAIRCDPENLAAHYDLALLYESRGELSAARAELRQVLALHPNDPARDDLARLEAQRTL